MQPVVLEFNLDPNNPKINLSGPFFNGADFKAKAVEWAGKNGIIDFENCFEITDTPFTNSLLLKSGSVLSITYDDINGVGLIISSNQLAGKCLWDILHLKDMRDANNNDNSTNKIAEIFTAKHETFIKFQLLPVVNLGVEMKVSAAQYDEDEWPQ